MGKGLLDSPEVAKRVQARLKEVRDLHFSNGQPLVVIKTGKIFNYYSDGSQVEIKTNTAKGS
jgi:hypothetical protein